MGYRAKVILDSIGPNEKRLISVEMTYPRFIHAEFMTHRDRARNAASSRAIPWKAKGKPTRIKDMPPGSVTIGKGQFSEISLDENETYEYYKPNCMYSMIMTEPVIPLSFDAEQKGMQSGDAVLDQEEARRIWLKARDNAVASADALAALGVHKSICNRLTEPFMWITVLCTATEWNNFFRLRCHPAAEKHFQKIAGMVRQAIKESTPQKLMPGQWHLPYVEEEDYRAAGGSSTILKMVSVGRCARLSYLTHDGKRDIGSDVALAEKLLRPPGDPDEEIMHASPFEHVASPSYNLIRSGPFIGWKQFRKEFPNENLEN